MRARGQPGLGRWPADELPADFAAQPPQTDARFVVLCRRAESLLPAGEPAAHVRASSSEHAPGKHALHVLPDYGHLDVFMGKDAAGTCSRASFDELER